MKDILSNIRDIVIIVGIYLYFIAWIYVHQYYQQFGISTSALKIDYSSLLVYSYNVITSGLFLFYLSAVLGIFLLVFIAFRYIDQNKDKDEYFRKIDSYIKGNLLVKGFVYLINKYPMSLIISGLVVIFPVLFNIAEQTAINNYKNDRMNINNLKTVQFIFRKNGEGLCPTTVLDSILPASNPLFSDISLIKDDSGQTLKLLNESDSYYIVLNQPRPFYLVDSTSMKNILILPRGYVYYVDKKDILLAKIFLRSF